MSAPRFKRPGMCVALMDRRRESAHSSNIAACLHKAFERTPPWRFMYATTDVLSVRISTCCRSSCAWNSFRAKKTASNSNRFMCNKPRWHTAEADAMSPSSLWNSSNEQSCLLWNGVGKTKWPPRALARGGLSFLGSLCKLPNTEWTDSGRECSFACSHIALGTPGE